LAGSNTQNKAAHDGASPPALVPFFHFPIYYACNIGLPFEIILKRNNDPSKIFFIRMIKVKYIKKSGFMHNF